MVHMETLSFVRSLYVRRIVCCTLQRTEHVFPSSIFPTETLKIASRLEGGRCHGRWFHEATGLGPESWDNPTAGHNHPLLSSSGLLYRQMLGCLRHPTRPCSAMQLCHKGRWGWQTDRQTNRSGTGGACASPEWSLHLVQPRGETWGSSSRSSPLQMTNQSPVLLTFTRVLGDKNKYWNHSIFSLKTTAGPQTCYFSLQFPYFWYLCTHILHTLVIQKNNFFEMFALSSVKGSCWADRQRGLESSGKPYVSQDACMCWWGSAWRSPLLLGLPQREGMTRSEHARPPGAEVTGWPSPSLCLGILFW